MKRTYGFLFHVWEIIIIAWKEPSSFWKLYYNCNSINTPKNDIFFASFVSNPLFPNMLWAAHAKLQHWSCNDQLSPEDVERLQQGSPLQTGAASHHELQAGGHCLQWQDIWWSHHWLWCHLDLLPWIRMWQVWSVHDWVPGHLQGPADVGASHQHGHHGLQQGGNQNM